MIAGFTTAALFGVIGVPDRPERFDAKQVVIIPAGGDALRIREVVDQDFGTQRRRGHERFIPTDFGVPTDLTAWSPSAPHDLSVEPFGDEVRVRIGDPGITITGQHRYVLEFTLPDARLASGELALDIIGTDELLETGRFEVIVGGIDLVDPRCNVGRSGAVGGCTLEREGAAFRTIITPLGPGDGLTIGGRIGSIEPAGFPELPPAPDRRSGGENILAALLVLFVGTLTGAGVYLGSSRIGRNEVIAGGPTAAAFGDLPPPNAGVTALVRQTETVTDRRLAEMATIEFSPPVGVRPWEASVLLRERVDAATASAWFSGLAGQEIITLEASGKALHMSWGPHRDRCDPATAALLEPLLGDRDGITLKGYDPAFARTWAEVMQHQTERIAASGWWSRHPPSVQRLTTRSMIPSLVAMGLIMLISFDLALWGITFRAIGWFSDPLRAVLLTVVSIGLLAAALYRPPRPARSTSGSALALRAESFRRFLAASEGRHVQWAWERGLLREYSAWAAALGAAKVWNRALVTSGLPADTVAMVSSPMLMATMQSTVNVAHSSSGGGSSGGSGAGSFSSGSVGGGGGGGRSGSW